MHLDFRLRPTVDMYSVAYHFDARSAPASTHGTHARVIKQVIEAHNRVLASRDLLYCSPSIRLLIEDDIPLLIGLLSDVR